MALRHFDYGPEANILAFPKQKIAIGVQVSADGAVSDANGRKIIPAGTPIGGADSALDKENAVLSKVADNTVQGILENAVDVTDGNGNGTMIIWGFINEFRLPEGVTIPDDVKTALNGKVTFLKRNNL